MSKLLTAVLAAVFAVVTVSPVAFAQEMKKEETKAKTETKKKAEPKKAETKKKAEPKKEEMKKEEMKK